MPGRPKEDLLHGPRQSSLHIGLEGVFEGLQHCLVAVRALDARHRQGINGCFGWPLQALDQFDPLLLRRDVGRGLPQFQVPEERAERALRVFSSVAGRRSRSRNTHPPSPPEASAIGLSSKRQLHQALQRACRSGCPGSGNRGARLPGPCGSREGRSLRRGNRLEDLLLLAVAARPREPLTRGSAAN